MNHTIKLFSFVIIFFLLTAGCQTVTKKQTSSNSWLPGVVGIYKGEIVSSGVSSHGVTTLSMDDKGALSGIYEFLDNENKVQGILYNCQAKGTQQLRCQWKDIAGIGDLEMSFDESGSKFTGYWNVKGRNEKSPWNGEKSGGQRNNDLPINLIPMYGYPNIELTAAQKKYNEEFIKSVAPDMGTRKKASKAAALEGWKYLSKGDTANAMRRFNQSWLLNPEYYPSYWGFGALLLTQNKSAEAMTHFEKSLSLIDEDGEKPRLLTDAARAYTIQGGIAATTDNVKSEKLFGKANSFFNEALKLNPLYGSAYRTWGLSLYMQGDYKKAWEIVKKAQSLGAHDFDPKFIEILSKKMPKPK